MTWLLLLLILIGLGWGAWRVVCADALIRDLTRGLHDHDDAPTLPTWTARPGDPGLRAKLADHARRTMNERRAARERDHDACE